MRNAFALFLLLHGIAHLVGFLLPWGILPGPGPGEAPPPNPNALFAGRLTLGDSAARGLGVLWLIAAVAFAIVAYGVWRQAPWSRTALVVVTLASLALSIAWWPTARIGVLINVAILATLMALAFRTYRSDVSAARAAAQSGSTMINIASAPIEFATLGEGEPILIPGRSRPR